MWAISNLHISIHGWHLEYTKIPHCDKDGRSKFLHTHFKNGSGFVHTSLSTEVTCRNKLRQSFDINKELFVNLSRYC